MMKKIGFLLGLLFFSTILLAQKVVNYPNFVDKNFSSEVTKIELTETSTAIHFSVKEPTSFVIVRKTYIEDASKSGEKLYIRNAEGIQTSQKVVVKNSEVKNYILYFPPLSKDVEYINYGEANKDGNWHIYKLDLTRNGIKRENKVNFNNFSQIVREPRPVVGYQIKETNINKNKISINNRNNEITPNELPENLFGNWYDKYGTIILAITPDFIILDGKINYYKRISKLGENKFLLKTSSSFGGFEILNIINQKLTIRTNRIRTLQKGNDNNDKLPTHIIGKWEDYRGIKKLTITENHFYTDDTNETGINKIVKSKIVHIAQSDNGDKTWIMIHNKGNYKVYTAKKVDNKYIIRPQLYLNVIYKKTKN
jgi:hypothetical protein